MSDLESTRTGWLWCALGIGWMAVAAGLTVWDLTAGSAIWPVSIITFLSGIVTIYFGRTQIRRARAHHRFMEDSREISRLYRDLGAP
jgi:hypothetical protein